jgi:nephrocystin-3
MVRVFLSSTFVDMHEEREVIMRRVMVELEKFCYDRGVSLTYIDMRWGML